MKRIRMGLATLLTMVLLVPSFMTAGTSFAAVPKPDDKTKAIGQKFAIEQLQAVTKEKDFYTLLSSKKGHKKLQQLLLKHVKTSHGIILNIYVATEKGSMILAPAQDLPAGYDPRTRPFYIDAKKGHSFSSPAYIDAVSGEFVSSQTQSLYNKKGTFVGVIAIDYFPYRIKGNAPFRFSARADSPDEPSYYMKSYDGDVVIQAIKKISAAATNDHLRSYIRHQNDPDLIKFLKKQDGQSTKLTFLATPQGVIHLSHKVDVAENYNPCESPWYQDALNYNHVITSEVYADPETGKFMMTLTIAVHDTPNLLGQEGPILGVLGMDIEIPADKIKQSQN